MKRLSTERSLAGLYEENRALLYTLCSRAVSYQARYHELIEDCIQETFVLAAARWEELREHPNIRGWLVKTCLNLLKDRQKEYGRRQRLLRRWWTAEARDSREQGDDLERHIRQEAARTALEKLMETLTPEENRLYAAYFLERQTMKSIAAREHMTENQVKNILKRIRRRARKALDEK